MSLPALLLHPDPVGRALVPYEFALTWNPSVVLGTLLLGALYLWAVGPARRTHGWGPAVPPLKVAAFLGALATIVFSLNGPMHDLSDEYLFSAHMVQHLLLALLMPPLLLWGTPGWLVERLTARPAVRRMAVALTRPLVAGPLFIALMTLGHFQPVYHVMMESHPAHIAMHLVFMASAVLMWWPTLSPTPAVPGIGLGARFFYLFLVSIGMQPVAAIITMASEPLYEWYVVAPRTFGLSPLDDQKLGGLLMWIPGNLWMFGAMAVVFFQWAKLQEDDAGAPAAEPAAGVR